MAGGCTGYMHKLDLDAVVDSGDYTFESSGIRMVVAKSQAELLKGTEVDYVREGDQEGFKILNPNADKAVFKKWLSDEEKAKTR